VHYSLAVLCASSGEGVAPVSGLDYLISFGYFLAWCISLAWLLIATSILLFVEVKVLEGWLRPMVG
jgi:hypothetical protein